MKLTDLLSKYIYRIIFVVMIVLLVAVGYWAYGFLTSNIGVSRTVSETELKLPDFSLGDYEKIIKKNSK